MSFLEDVTKGGWTTAVVGVGAALVAPSMLPAVGSALRPLAKVLIKGGVVAYDAVKEGLAETVEQVNDLVAEARAELAEGATAAEGPARATVAGTSRKDTETERKPATARKET